MQAVILWWQSQSVEVQALVVGAILWFAQESYTRYRGLPGLELNSPNNVKRGVALIAAVLGALALYQAGNVSDAIGVLVAAVSAFGGSQALASVCKILQTLFPAPAPMARR